MNYYISKSDFKIGRSCPQKLLYKKRGYPTQNDDNEYMKYLAQGGYIVGKMAQMIYHGGEDLSGISDWRKAEARTRALIEGSAYVTIYDATIFSNGKLVRIDILEKKGNVLHIIEVKAKSQDSTSMKQDNKMAPHVEDVLFQVITLEEAYPDYEVKGSLFLPDKSKLNKIEGLAGWFYVQEKKKEVPELDEAPARTSSFYLPEVVFRYEDHPEKDQYLAELKEHSILELRDIKQIDLNGDWAPAKAVIKNAFINLYESVIEQIKPIQTEISRQCKQCEYSSDHKGLNGWKECWKELEGKDLFALDLYRIGNRGPYLDGLIANRTLSIDDLDLAFIANQKKGKPMNNMAIRQLMQIEAAREGREIVHKDVLSFELERLEYPLYFIDFETFTGAIPFHRNMRPYEDIAFQWSCHKLDSPDGELAHYEWINEEESFPNFRFAESLMKIIGDRGTPLMWSNHENKILKRILHQMEVHDYYHPALANWLLSMTKDKDTKRKGRLVDMAEICERSYVHPDCKGKISIKKIFPVIWNNMENKHIHEHKMFRTYFRLDEDGHVLNPYKTLDPIEDFIEHVELEAEEVVDEGTGAMKAYYEMMYGKGRNNPAKRAELKRLLLQYCKLDTIAMVIIYNYWQKVLAGKEELV